MKRSNFRKLRVDLPIEPTINQRPWIIAGWLLVVVILLFAARGFYAYKTHKSLPVRQQNIQNITDLHP